MCMRRSIIFKSEGQPKNINYIFHILYDQQNATNFGTNMESIIPRKFLNFDGISMVTITFVSYNIRTYIHIS